MTIRCAICAQPTSNGAENPWRPFCGERCKLLDLSSWLGEEYVIPGEAATDPRLDPNGDPESTLKDR